MRRAPAVAAAAALVTAGPAPAQTPDALTPEVPATLQQTWLGPVPAIAYGPRVITRWHVTVGPGGRSGHVALRVIRSVDGLPTGAGASPFHVLPAEAGTYSFASSLRYRDGDHVGLDQHLGGHAILRRHAASSDHATDVWRPPLADGSARDASERLRGRELALTVTAEPDVDEDGRGDQTGDVNNLALRDTRAVIRRRVHATFGVRNRGRRTVHRPAIVLRPWRGSRLLAVRAPACDPQPCPHPGIPASGRERVVALPPLAPGRTHRIRLTLTRPDRRSGTFLIQAVPEGVERTPIDNLIRLARR